MNNKKIIILLILAIGLFVGVTYWEISFEHYVNKKVEETKKERKQEKMLERQRGIETTALVVDKSKKTQLMVKVTTTNYYLKLYASNEIFEILVSPSIYSAVERGDFVEAVIKDNYILLGNKGDKDEVLRIIDREKVLKEDKKVHSIN